MNEIKKVVAWEVGISNLRRYIPFIEIENAIDNILTTVVSTDSINYEYLEMFTVIHSVLVSLNAETEYDLPYFERENEDEPLQINYYQLYDDIMQADLFDKVRLNSECIERMLLILNKKVAMIEKSILNTGMFEGQIIKVVESLGTSMERISLSLSDEKKIKGIVKEFTKSLGKLKPSEEVKN